MTRFNFVFVNWRCWLAALLLCAPAAGLAQEEPILEIDPQGHLAQINDVMFTPDGHVLISIAYDKTIRLWDIASGELLKTIRGQIGEGHEGTLLAGALSPDGRTLAVGVFGITGGGKPIHLYDIETGEQISILNRDNNLINALAFSRDGQLLVSGSQDNTVRIWQVTNARGSAMQGEAFATLEGHRDHVYGVAFAPDGSKVVSASFDHTLPDCVKRACVPLIKITIFG